MLKRVSMILALALPLVAADVTGKWTFQVDLDMGSGSPMFTFEQDGEQLTGTYSGALGSAPLKGTVKEDRIEFTFEGDYDGQQFTVQYTGTISADETMKGKCDYAGQASGTWTARRAE